MNCNKIVIILLMLSMLLFSSYEGLANGASGDTLEWLVPENHGFVYNIEELNVNGSDYFTIDDSGSSFNIYEGENLYYYPMEFPSNDSESNVTFDVLTSFTYEFSYEYQLPLEPTWELMVDGFNYLFIVLPNYTINNQYDSFQSEFENNGYTVTNNATHYEISGSNATANVTLIDAIWEKATGVLLKYTLDGYSEDFGDIKLVVSFKYFQDMSEWGEEWKISEHSYIGWKYDVLEWNGTNRMLIDPNRADYGENDSGEESYYIYEGDVLLNGIETLNPVSYSSSYTWSGSIMTSRSTMYVTNASNSILYKLVFGASFIPVPNQMGLGNYSDRLETGHDYDFSINGNIWNITYQNETYYESVLFDMDTGINMKYVYIGNIDDIFVHIEFHNIYYIPIDEVSLQWRVGPDALNLRYKCTTVKNGTDDYILFGNSEEDRFYSGDIIDVEILEFSDLENEPPSYQFIFETNHGIKINESDAVVSYMVPIGFEFSAGSFFPRVTHVVPLGSDTHSWINLLLGAYESLGYSIINTSESFGFRSTVYYTDYEILYDKETGILTSLSFNSTIKEIAFKMVNVPSPLEMELGHSWGVQAGTELPYHFTLIDINGENWLEVNETTQLHEDETIVLEIINTSDENMSYIYRSKFQGYSLGNVYRNILLPGYEFVYDNSSDGSPVMLYPLFPVGSTEFYDSIATFYTDVGYTVTLTNETLSIEGSFEGRTFNVEWNKTTGILLYYEYHSSDMNIILVFGEGTVFPTSITTTSSATTSDTSYNTNSTSVSDTTIPELSRGFEGIFVLPTLIAVVALFKRHRR